MDILARYIHGSEDSTDLDVLYVAASRPSSDQCVKFCNADPAENRNLCTVSNGTVEWCFKGAEDEVNNALLATYPLHTQEFPLLISRAVPRNLVIKLMIVLRKSLMELRYAGMSREVHHALKRGLKERMELAGRIDLRELTWDCTEAELLECRKRMAFQLGQAVGLYHGKEFYTKNTISDAFPALRPYLRRELCEANALEEMRRRFLDIISEMRIEDAGGQMIACPVQGGRRVFSLSGKEHELTDEPQS